MKIFFSFFLKKTEFYQKMETQKKERLTIYENFQMIGLVTAIVMTVMIFASFFLSFIHHVSVMSTKNVTFNSDSVQDTLKLSGFLPFHSNIDIYFVASPLTVNETTTRLF